jgi:predicted enzyme related to lactoylglutathione lyase
LRDVSEVVTDLYAVSVHVRDIHKARAFYRGVLGLKERSSDEGVGRATFFMPGTSTILRIHIRVPDEGGREPGTVSGILFRYPDPPATYAEIARRGGTVTNEPRVVELPGPKFVLGVFADPDGNGFVLTSRSD